MGEIYFDELDDHENAERCYRQALLLQPGNADAQQTLFKAVAKQRLFYRFLSIPSRAWRWFGDVLATVRYEPWRVLLFLIFIKGWLIFFTWLIVTSVLFVPACKIYEWLIVSEIRRSSTASDVHLRLWARFRRIPVFVRFSLFMVLNIGLWWGLLAYLAVPADEGFTFIGAYALGHWFCTAVLFWCRKVRSSSGRRRAERRRKKTARTPPPLPRQS